MYSFFIYNTCLFQLQKLLCLTLSGKDFVNAIESGAMSGPMNVLDPSSSLTKNLHFDVPKAVKELSVSHLFNFELEQNCYTLLSQKGSITPWHVDYTNTSVFYHLLHGRKEFFMIPGTVRNQEILENWCIEATKQNVFLPSDTHLQSQVFKMTITGGESLIMPAGMIHMVKTCADSVAVGFNFITICELGNYEIQFSYNIVSQLFVRRDKR